MDNNAYDLLKDTMKYTFSKYYEVCLVDFADGTYKRIYSKNNETDDSDNFSNLVDLRFNNGIINKEDEKNIRNFLSPENMRETLKKTECTEYQYLRKNSNGAEEWCLTSCFLKEKENDVPKTAVITIRNIDDVIKREQAQRKMLIGAVHQAEVASKSKSVFISNVSHDIRTPLNAIIGYANLALTHLGDTKRAEDYLSKIIESGNHLQSLLSDVLDLSKIESGKFNSEERMYSIAKLADVISEMFKCEAKNKNIHLVIDTSKVKDTDIYCDYVRLNQIFINIVGNALKYTPNGGTVKFIVKQTGLSEDYCSYRFETIDSGIGISPEFMDKIFEPYERESGYVVNRIQGTGLGMSICKKFVDMMGGNIKVESEVGLGTKFTVNLKFKKAVKETSCPEKEEERSAAAKFTHKKRILLVEDNDMNREIGCEILKDAGYLVEEAENGQVAVELVNRNACDYYNLILMDIRMPVMDGYEATRRIRMSESDRKTIPIIAMTANVFEDNKKMSADMGMDGHISKPINQKTMLKTIADILT